MNRSLAPVRAASDRGRLLLLCTAILGVVSLLTMVVSVLHVRAAGAGEERFAIVLATAQTVALAIAGGTLVVRVCNPFMRRLEESEAQMRAILSNAGDGIIALDAQGRILSANHAAERQFGRCEAALVHTNISERIVLSSGRNFAAELSACRATPEMRASQKAVGRADDVLFSLELSLSCVRPEEPALFTVIVRDTTARETAQQQLRAQMAQLRETKEALEAQTEELAKSNRDLDDFTYIASHDLKEPLLGISGYCQMLLEDYGPRLDAEGRRRLETLVALCQRLGRLIDDLLAYSKIGRHEPEARDVDLGEVVADVLETLGPAIDRRKARVRVKGRLPRADVDGVMIGEVFRNLIANALKFNDSPRPRVVVGSVDAQTIYVRDNGIGIDACHHEAIFAMFRRLHARSKYDGTGAGLTLVRKIVEAHGGRVWVESEPGRGTTFFFTLGATAAPAPAATRAVPSTAPPSIAPAAAAPHFDHGQSALGPLASHCVN